MKTDNTMIKVVGINELKYIRLIDQLEKIKDRTSYLIKLVGIEPKEISDSEIEEIIKKPEKLLEIIETIKIACLNLNAAHNYYTFFALSTRTITFKFMMAAYPRLADNFDSLIAFLGIKKIFEPQIDDKEDREAYSIWGHSKDGLCDSLYNLYLEISELSHLFILRGLGSLGSWMEYEYITSSTLKEMKWQFPPYLAERYGMTYLLSKHVFVISGALLYSKSKGKEYSINLFKLLDDISPGLFLSRIELTISNGELIIRRKEL